LTVIDSYPMQINKLFFILSVFMIIPVLGNGQVLKIEVELKEAAGQEVYLAHYYAGNIYAKDTLLLDVRGSGVFLADSLLPQGLYKIYRDENAHFDFLLGNDQQFILRNETFNAETISVSGSEETEAFVAYSTFLKNLQKRNAEIRKSLESSGTREKEKSFQELNALTNHLYAYWDELEKAYPGSFLAKFVKATHVPALDISSLPREVQENDSLLLVARFYYQKAHFWDNFDYRDERLLFTPFYKNKLETWFTKVLFQNYDSIGPEVHKFIEEVKHSRRIFQYATSFFLNSSINSNIMGMDALFVDLARKYYLSGEAFWATDEALEKIRENVLFFENNLIGKQAPDLTLEGVDGQYHNLNQIDSKYTLVVIYEPGCSHCKVFVPQLYNEVYLPFRNKGLEVFAIYSMDKKYEWEKFLNEHELHDWTNVWDEHHVSRFKILYDARTTPGIFLLDEHKKIVAKKMTVEQVRLFMQAQLH
jgi:peroxiredoxin